MQGVGGAIVAFVMAISMTASVIERNASGAHVFDLGPVPRVAPGQVLAVQLQAPNGVRTARFFPKFTAVYVTRLPGDRIAVFPNTTPIAGCLLLWEPPRTRSGPAFTDPCEGGQWDAEGRYLSGREQQDLLRLPVTVTDAGRLTVDTLNVAKRDAIEVLSPAGADSERRTVPAGPAAEPAPAQIEWVLVPIVAEPARSPQSGLAGPFAAMGRQWGLSAGDVALLAIAILLALGACGLLVYRWIERRPRPSHGPPSVYLEWRTGRRWSPQPSDLTLRPRQERHATVRLANYGHSSAAGASVTFEVEEPLSIDIKSRFGVTSHVVLPHQVLLRWEFRRRLPAGSRSPVARLRLSRSDEDAIATLSREVVVRCVPADGGQETRSSIPVRLM